MSAPDRSANVRTVLAVLPVVAKTVTDDGRRANLFSIIRALNLIDAGQWGALIKTDQGDKIPGDIAVWKPTMEHFDVITGAGGPAWIAHGPITYAPWHWFDVGDHAVIPVPVPEPVEPDVDPFAAILEHLRLIQGQLDRKPPRYQGKLFGYTVTLDPV